MPELKVVSGALTGQVLPLAVEFTLRIGRGAPPASPEPGVEHFKIDDKRLSRLHCEVALSDGKWIARDLGSSNGTFVNGERIREKVLAHGDLLQAGGTIFEVASLEAADASTEEREPERESDAAPLQESAVVMGVEEPSNGVLENSAVEADASDAEAAENAEEGASPVVRRRPARRAARSGAAFGYVVFVAGVCLAAWAVSVVLRPAKSERSPGQVASARAAQPAASSAGAKSSVPLAAEPAADAVTAAGDPDVAVEPPLLAGDYRRALAIVEETFKGPATGRAAEVRKRVAAAAAAELAKQVQEAERLSGAGEYAAAREALEQLMTRLPEDLAAEAALALDRVRKLEDSSPKIAEPPAAAVSQPSHEPLSSKRLVELQASFQMLSADKETTPAAWASLGEAVAGLVREWREHPEFASEHEKLRSLFIACAAKSPDTAKVRGLFSAARVELKDGRLLLSYDFASDGQATDFHAVGKAKVRRDASALALRGECRLLHGDPFEGKLTVRAKVAATGFDPAAPNLNVALFTRAGDRLTDDQKAAPSLFTAFVRGTGPEPSGFAAFCLGYRTVTAVYGEEPLEQITPNGSSDPVKMPVNTILTGQHGKLLHSDARECLWAVPAAAMRGAIELEVVLGASSFSWSVNGKPIVDAKDPRLARLRALSEPAGSVTLFTRRSEVRFLSIEVEGALSPKWIQETLEKAADLEFEKIERG